MPAPRDPSPLQARAPVLPRQPVAGRDRRRSWDITRSNVSRMLTDAQRQGIVEIRINDPAGRSAPSSDDSRSVRPERGPGRATAGRPSARSRTRRACSPPSLLTERQRPDDGGVVVGHMHSRAWCGPRPPTTTTSAHPGPAGRRTLLHQQRDQRRRAGPRARRPARRRRTATCTHRPPSPPATARTR